MAMFAMVSCGSNSQKESAATTATDETATEESVATTDSFTPVAGEVNKIEKDGTLQPANLPIVVDFNATWCGPCQMFAPVFDKAAKANSEKLYFYSIDIDKCPELAKAYDVQSIPQVLILYPDGRVERATPGFMDEAAFDTFLSKI